MLGLQLTQTLGIAFLCCRSAICTLRLILNLRTGLAARCIARPVKFL